MVLPSRRILLVTCQCLATWPLMPTVMSTGGRQDCGPLTTARLPLVVLAAVTTRPGSRKGAASSLLAVVDSIDQTTQPCPRGVVVSSGSPPAKVPLMLNRVTAACL